jgi:hypothetical protein
MTSVGPRLRISSGSRTWASGKARVRRETMDAKFRERVMRAMQALDSSFAELEAGNAVDATADRVEFGLRFGDQWLVLGTWRSQTMSKISSMLPLNQI